ncbi:MAG TPA: ABC transporter permease [Acidimicrobiales bacterium]|nr:ABC transporter permease [Acidimicrobiales bacterium]
MTDVHADTGTRTPDGEAVPDGSGTQTVISQKRDDELAARAIRVAARGSKPTRTVSARVSVRLRLIEMWRARELFVFLVRKEIKVRYKNSVLGFLWSMLNPALTLAVFYVLFTYFLPNGIPYFVIYMFSAMLVWNLYQTALLSGTVSVVVNAGIVKKVAFPREILVLASVGSAFVYFFYQSLVMIGFMIAFHHSPAWSDIWLLIPALAAIVVFAAALSIFLSAVNVYLRDTQHLVEVLLVAWFWAIPTVYAFSGRVQQSLRRHTILFIPHTRLIWLYFSNPVTPVVMTFQRVFYNIWNAHSTKLTPASPIAKPIGPNITEVVGTKPAYHAPLAVMAHYPIHWYVGADLAVLGVSILLFLGALMVFGHLEGNFAEEL